MCIHHCFQNKCRHFDKDPNDILAPLKLIDTKNFKNQPVVIQRTKFYTQRGFSFVHAHDLLRVTGNITVFA